VFDPGDPYEGKWNGSYARQELSIAQIIAQQSVDVETVALTWLILEHGASLTVAGPTEPRPGTGKSTVLHALLPFLPEGSALVYMSGMDETFAFTRLPDVHPATTYALCSEISDHQRTYMWGRMARRYLMLPSQGYHILTCVHADTIDDVLHLYQHDLCLGIEALRHLGLIVNIGLKQEGKSRQRRWLTTYFLQPNVDLQQPDAVLKLPLSVWNKWDDTFEHADSSVLEQLAEWVKLPLVDFTNTLRQRTECLRELTQGKVADMDQTCDAIMEFKKQSGRLPLFPTSSYFQPKSTPR
jgi:hypothetical protein